MSQLTVFDTSSIMGDVSQLIPDSGTSPVVPTAGGAITVTSTNGINTVGGLNTININLDAEIVTLATATTVGATTATCGTITVPANSAAIINILVVGADTANFALNIVSNLVIQAWNVGAGAVQGANDDIGGGSTAPADVAIASDTSGNDVRVRVTGTAGQTYNWKSYIRYQIVS